MLPNTGGWQTRATCDFGAYGTYNHSYNTIRIVFDMAAWTVRDRDRAAGWCVRIPARTQMSIGPQTRLAENTGQGRFAIPTSDLCGNTAFEMLL